MHGHLWQHRQCLHRQHWNHHHQGTPWALLSGRSRMLELVRMLVLVQVQVQVQVPTVV